MTRRRGVPAEAEVAGEHPPEIPYASLKLSDPLISGRGGRGITVAVLDSGVNTRNPHVRQIVRGIGIGPTGREREGFIDTLGHGTAVVAAIQEKSPEAEILAIKVFDRELATTLPGLLAALDHALESRARLVNLSLGTSRAEHRMPLEEVIARLIHHGSLVVSPYEHRGHRWWPGSIPGVVGVLLDRGCPRDSLRVIEGPDGRSIFRASGLPRPIRGVSEAQNLSGISFATANVTGLLARLLEAKPEIRSAEEVTRSIRASHRGRRPESQD